MCIYIYMYAYTLYIYIARGREREREHTACISTYVFIHYMYERVCKYLYVYINTYTYTHTCMFMYLCTRRMSYLGPLRPEAQAGGGGTGSAWATSRELAQAWQGTEATSSQNPMSQKEHGIYVGYRDPT